MAIDPITTMNTDPEESLLGVLAKIRDLQSQPLIQANPLAQIGAALQGFHSGMTGQPNPAIAQAQQQRQADLTGLKSQADIAGSMATISNQRTQRSEKDREFALNLAKDLENSDSYEERLQALRLKQGITNPMTGRPLIPAEAPIQKMAYMKGKDYAGKWDQALEMLKQGENPFDPAKYGDQFPREFFPADVFAKAQQGGPMALEALKKNPKQPTEGSLKARYVYLEGRGALTDGEKAEKEALHTALKLEPTGQNTVLTLAKAMKAEDTARGLPVKSDSAYIETAFKRTDRSESFEKDLEDEANRRGLTGAGKFAWKDEKRQAYQKTIAEVKMGAQPLPLETANKLTLLRDAKRTVTALMTEFSAAERAKYAGWFAYTGRQLMQAVANDAKFARFKALIARAQTDLAFVDAGKALTGIEKSTVFGWVITGKEISLADFEAKLREAYDRTEAIMEDTITMAVNPRSFIKAKDAVTPPATPVSPGGQPFRFERKGRDVYVLPGGMR